MVYRTTIQPLCRCCGKPIAKETDTVWIGNGDSKIAGPLYSKADCQAQTNASVISISYDSLDLTARHHPDANGRRSVWKFSTWDGESYRDEFFCRAPCAVQFAYIMARVGKCTNHYNEAIAKQRG